MLEQGDSIQTDDAGRAEINYTDGSLTRLSSSTEFTITKLTDKRGGRQTAGHAERRRDVEPRRQGLRERVVRGEGRRYHRGRRRHRVRVLVREDDESHEEGQEGQAADVPGDQRRRHGERRDRQRRRDPAAGHRGRGHERCRRRDQPRSPTTTSSRTSSSSTTSTSTRRPARAVCTRSPRRRRPTTTTTTTTTTQPPRPIHDHTRRRRLT